jgi:propionyl-CoA carboxylase alpha chain
VVIQLLLVANRGEIARRVFRTCRDLGIGTVAVHSDADAGLPFVREADVAVRLPGSTPAETYLRGDLLVAAARSAGADAVHPGYGFLSESADFARQVIDAGLTWVGPSPESMEQMASKVAAKRLMAAAGVPVLPELDPAVVSAVDLPLLVKASAGGGGRGMRVVRALADVADAVEQASAEAASAFGDATVFCEPYVATGRHVEVQVLGDTHGTISVVGDRDCSVQRRHQKVVEEAPAPGLDEATRSALHAAARSAAEAIGYVGAGTVEFLYDERARRFWFLEMNTRLQVEHPVTELLAGLDLVEQQIKIAEGHQVTVLEGAPTGHAVEVRLYAEDPAHDYRPQSGRLTRFDVPGVLADFGPLPHDGIRVDAGFGAGDEVGTHYDAMIAKVICRAATRTDAVRRLAAALERAEIHGVRTNRDLLVEVLRHPRFLAGDVSTDFLDRHDLAALSPRAADPDAVHASAFAAAVVLAERPRGVQHGIPAGWRNVVSQPQRTVFTVAGEEVVAEWQRTRAGYASGDLRAELSGGEVVMATSAPDNSGVVRRFRVYLHESHVDVESDLGHVALLRTPRFLDPADSVASGSLLAPMPGSVVRLHVEAGADVAAGQPVLVLEAMKMQHTITAPHDGTVADLPVAVGAQVAAGEVLAVVSTSSTTREASSTTREASSTTRETGSTSREDSTTSREPVEGETA